jgi:hypothetical protein
MTSKVVLQRVRDSCNARPAPYVAREVAPPHSSRDIPR